MNYGVDTGFLVAVEIVEHPQHSAARRMLEQIISSGDRLTLAPQVLAEFIHVVTDSKRFERPLSIDTARMLAAQWWDAPETDHAYPDEQAVSQFLSWHGKHRLGRKRLLDTLLAATYDSTGITSILTMNPRDFAVLATLESVVPE